MNAEACVQCSGRQFTTLPYPSARVCVEPEDWSEVRDEQLLVSLLCLHTALHMCSLLDSREYAWAFQRRLWTSSHLWTPQFFHRSSWSACSSPAYNAASGSHGVKPLSLINFWLMNYGQCLHKHPSQMKTSLRMDFLRVPSVRPNSTVLWGRSFCGAPSPFCSL